MFSAYAVIKLRDTTLAKDNKSTARQRREEKKKAK